MKSELEILLDYMQKEVDHLQSSMDACIAEYDFDGAKAFLTPLFYSRRKLQALNSVQNPNSRKISQLEHLINRFEQMLAEEPSVEFPGAEKLYVEMRKQQKETLEKRIVAYRIELERLTNIPSITNPDDDKTMRLLESLQRGEINCIKIKLYRNELFLIIKTTKDNTVLLSIKSNQTEAQDYLTQPAKTLLGKRGFDIENLDKHYTAFPGCDLNEIIIDLAVMYYEVFNSYLEVDREIEIIS